MLPHDGAQRRDAGLPAAPDFPSEAEWLDLPPPPIAPDFVARTVAAVLAAGNAAGPEGGPSREQLASFAPPEPSPDFVARTLQAVRQDRVRRWRELLARYVAPEPSPAFVARTLRALADRPVATGGTAAAARRRRWTGPLLAAAAAVVTAIWLLRAQTAPPLEARLAGAVRPAFAHGYAAASLPGLLAALERDADPAALPAGGADGTWLLLHRRRR